MNNCPAFGYVLGRGLRRDRATDHTVKELTDIYETTQILSFLSGSTHSLSDVLSVAHLHTYYEVNVCNHMCLLMSLSKQREN